MSWNWKKASVIGTLSLASVLTLTACASGGSKDAKETDGKTIVVSVDEGYADYIKSIKGEFEKENKVTVKVKKEGMMILLISYQQMVQLALHQMSF